MLGKDIIHSVTNPIPRLTGAIHVYSGDFFATERSEWDPEALAEARHDVRDDGGRIGIEVTVRLAIGWP